MKLCVKSIYLNCDVSTYHQDWVVDTLSGQVGDKLELAEKASVGPTITASTAGFSVTRHTRLGIEFGESVRDLEDQ